MSQVGVGTVAAGVAKAYSDVVLISGHDGGTGASPLSSIKHAGGPWELGLAETQQTLLRNGLRDRIVVQTDGQLKTGRDVVIAALLGAEEFGFATAPLVVLGLHHDARLPPRHLPGRASPRRTRSCASGSTGGRSTSSTSCGSSRRRSASTWPSWASGRIEEAVGQSEVLDVDDAVRHWKTEGLDLTPIFPSPSCPPGTVAAPHDERRTTAWSKALDNTLIQLLRGRAALRRQGAAGPAGAQRQPHGRHHARLRADEALGRRGPARRHHRRHAHRLGRAELRRVPAQGHHPAADRRHATTTSARASPAGGSPCGPTPTAPFVAEENVIAGNVILYGATSGEIFVRGIVGERFCVRNSGALAVVEGVGDHGCEYMTGGTAVVLGRIGRNFAAGMSGGVAYVLDLPRSTGSTRRWSTSTRSTTTTARSCATPSSATTPRPARRWPTSCSPTGTTPSTGSARSCPRTSSGCCKARDAAEREGRDVERGDHGGRTWVTRRGS